MTKRTALRYTLAYLFMWAMLGVVILQNAPDGNLTQAGLMKGSESRSTSALAMVAAMEATARAAWSRMRNLRQRQKHGDRNG